MDKDLFNWPSAEEILVIPCKDHGKPCDIPTERYNGKVISCHRLAFCKKFNIEPEVIKHYMVHRACTNSRCIEPSHLILCPGGQSNPYLVLTGKEEGKELWKERVKENPHDYLYPEYRNYRIKEYVN